MPIYEYQCKNNHRTERVKGIKVSDKERDSDKCEVCGERASLVPSHPARPILVGAGFHENDYRHGKLGT